MGGHGPKVTQLVAIIGFKFIMACPGALLDPEGEDSRALKIKRRKKRAAEGEGRVRVRGAFPV